ncbi:MAG: 23S rRNA (adenine(2503)-C(2))-methyltransferase RlmN [Coriobacteriales bacterium]|jgi:23S rRNA (adenine2503-C2)-methyltransferase|nr:23S rRNA (adenine(2503)-C(2))-methyltransferase RlmN [Coriobacteriales bacterium]
MTDLSTRTDKLDIKALDSAELTAHLATLGQPAYRARQIERWLYAPVGIVGADEVAEAVVDSGAQAAEVLGEVAAGSEAEASGAQSTEPQQATQPRAGVRSFDEMTDLPLALRELLSRSCSLSFPEVSKRLVSRDGSRKYLLRLADGAFVECVGIPTKSSLTVCFSTQVGCAMGCVFCATGSAGLARSLTPGEMVDQLSVVAADFEGRRITNAVAMGQGEPFANYDATLAALRFMNNPKLLGIGARHLTVSTCGLLSGLRRFSTEPEQFTLAISLHSAVQKTRDVLMPGLATQPLLELQKTLANYAEKTRRRPSLEYALIEGVNDTDEELEALIAFCKWGSERRSLSFHVNLIPLNSVGGADDASGGGAASSGGAALGGGAASSSAGGGVRASSGGVGAGALVLRPSLPARVEEFARALKNASLEVTIRSSRGDDINGACGQLAGSR